MGDWIVVAEDWIKNCGQVVVRMVLHDDIAKRISSLKRQWPGHSTENRWPLGPKSSRMESADQQAQGGSDYSVSLAYTSLESERRTRSEEAGHSRGPGPAEWSSVPRSKGALGRQDEQPGQVFHAGTIRVLDEPGRMCSTPEVKASGESCSRTELVSRTKVWKFKPYGGVEVEAVRSCASAFKGENITVRIPPVTADRQHPPWPTKTVKVAEGLGPQFSVRIGSAHIINIMSAERRPLLDIASPKALLSDRRACAGASYAHDGSCDGSGSI
ncbi:hypothetical protein MSG28_013894 [Choristoneura fumiferana]|uniref:Uncharacterized protein n=1 Tax=Choristoneura fumiferana TaxID=7141 RepID=A0ACC0K996_CHOFU|nr:hypothetical protein MSG28_013894 [Choristoneura fumiferana]